MSSSTVIDSAGRGNWLGGLLALALGSVLALSLISRAAADDSWASRIQEVRSGQGITAWLVESHAQPVIAIRFAFAGGSSREPADRRGMSDVLAEMLGEGAGPYDGPAFRQRADRLSARLSFFAARDAISGSVDALSRNLDATADLLAAQINAPRIEASALERVVRRKIAAIRDLGNDPAAVAEDAWYAATFGAHPYAAPSSGSPDTLGRITTADLADFRSRHFAKANLVVAVAGDISPERLAALLDKVFGSLRREPRLQDLAPLAPVRGRDVTTVERDVPEANVVFGFGAPHRHDPQFMPALVLNEILGGSVTGSRLGDELRARQGLVYGIDTRLIADAHAAIVLGQFSTATSDLERALGSVRVEVGRLAKDGPTTEEVETAKSFLIGAFPLSFDSSAKIADNLVAIAQAGLGIDYVDRRRRAIEAVTRDTVRATAVHLLQPDRVTFAVVRGRPAAQPTPR